jgi:riboflavin kinase / FMN adenylyltransferase
VLLVEFTPQVAATSAEEFAQTHVLALGAEVVVAGEGFRFGSKRGGDLGVFERLGAEVRETPLVPGIASRRIRELLTEGDVRGTAEQLGRPAEVEGLVVSGDARGGTLGFPTANLRVDHAVLVPRYGIYAGSALDHRAAVSIGVNPHYGGSERRVEAFLLDFEDDLYNRRVVVELWDRLRDETVFQSEADLIAQIARDVEETRRSTRPGS